MCYSLWYNAPTMFPATGTSKSCISTPIENWTHVYMKIFTQNSPYYYLLKYLLFLLKHPVYSDVERTQFTTLSYTLVFYYQLCFRSKYLLQNPNIFGQNPLIIHTLPFAYCTLNPHFSLVIYFAISLRRPKE